VTILDEILETKREEVAAHKRALAPDALRARAEAVPHPPLGFRSALNASARPRVIAEIKRRSPSKGEIRPHFDPVDCARAYALGGAAALSVLTDERYFGGHLDYLRAVRAAVKLPLLRKDFVIDPYQIDEARVAGADAVLLIVAALRPDELASLYACARQGGLDVLTEVHDEKELEIALAAGVDTIGINNRNLKTFHTDLATSERLLAGISKEIVTVSESGIETYAQIERLEAAGADAFLVGEALMRQPDLRGALERLRGYGKSHA